MEEQIYANEDTEMKVMDHKDDNMYVNVGDLKPGTRGDEVQAQPRGWFRILSRVAAVCLGLLVILLLAGIIGLWFYHSEERSQWEMRQHELLTGYNNLTKERDLLQTSNNALTTERDKLQTSNKALTTERDKLQTSIKALTNRNAQLLNLLSRGFREFGGSVYYISTEEKTFEASRQDCQNRGADLVIINNPNELQFLKGLNIRPWIGLTDLSTNSNRNFKWVDGSSLTTGYWKSNEPNNFNNNNERCVEFDNTQADVQKSWNDLPCDGTMPYVCEDSFKLKLK